MIMSNYYVMRSRDPTENETYALSEFLYLTQNKLLKYFNSVMILIMASAFILQIFAIRDSFRIYPRQIVVLCSIILLIIVCTYVQISKPQCSKRICELQRGNCYMFDCVCVSSEVLGLTVNDKYSITVSLDDGTILPYEYVVKKDDLSVELGILTAADLIGKKILICYMPNIKYVKVFVGELTHKTERRIFNEKR